MKGLVLKDLYNIKNNIFMIIIFIIFLGTGVSILFQCVSLFHANTSFIPLVFTIITIVISSMMVMTCIKLDAAVKWDKLAITMPVTRKQIVLEKYILYIILCIFGIFLGFFISLIFSAFKMKINLYPFLLGCGLGMGVSLIAGSFMIPCAFLLGLDKSEVSLLVSYFLACLLTICSARIFNKFMLLNENINIYSIVLLLLGTLFYIFSFFITNNKYKIKDIS